MIHDPKISVQLSVTYPEALAATQKSFLYILIFSTISLILMGILLTWAIKKMLRPVGYIVERCDQIANYDLTGDLDVQFKGEFGLLAESLNTMRLNNLTLLSEIKRICLLLNQNFSTVQNATHGISQMIEETTASLSTSTINIFEQAKEVEKLNQSSASLEENVNWMSEAIIKTVDDGESVSSSINTSQSKMQEMKQQFNVTVTGFEQLNDKMSDLYQKSGSIMSIIETIRGIAGQTNLLALNASIEAARAGEQGRGFAVVADEIRKLAEESAHSVSEIEGIIQNVLSEIKASNEVTKSNHELMVKAHVSVDETIGQFSNSKTLISSIVERIKLLGTKTETLLHVQNTVVKGTSVVEALSKKNAQMIEDVNQAAEEECANVEEISASIDDLNQIIQVLSANVNKYKN